MYYIYRHIRLDKDEVFYIGLSKSNPRRDTHHETYRRAYCSQRSQLWKNIASKGYDVEIMIDNLTKEEASIKEIEFISLYGLRSEGGTLCNFTTGGESSFELTEEQRRTISERMKGNTNGLGSTHTEKTRKLISDRFKGNTTWRGRKHKPESIEKIRKALSGKSRLKKVFNVTGTPKRVVCVETSVEYPTVSECARNMFGFNRNYKNQIIKALKNKSSYRGFNFNYL